VHDIEQRLRAELRAAVASSRAAAPANGDPAGYSEVVRRHRRRLFGARAGAGAGLVAILAAAVALQSGAQNGTAPNLTGDGLQPAPRNGSTTSTTIEERLSGVPAGCRLSPMERQELIGRRGDGTADGLVERFCGEPSFTVTPTSGPPGTTLSLRGHGCKGSNLSVEVGQTNSRMTEQGWRIERDGTFSGRLTMPVKGLPGDYWIKVSCLRGGSGTQLRGHRIFTMTAPPSQGGRGGTPDPAAFTASVQPHPDGVPRLRLSGAGCFLAQLGGVPGGSVSYWFTKPGDNESWMGGMAEVREDGTWGEPEGGVRIPERFPTEIRAACGDEMFQTAFEYRRVYRLENGRLTEVTPRG
jgi:hypothetical protein